MEDPVCLYLFYFTTMVDCDYMTQSMLGFVVTNAETQCYTIGFGYWHWEMAHYIYIFTNNILNASFMTELKHHLIPFLPLIPL